MSKTGICFSGGGARGAYQLGALKALEEMGIFQQTTAYSGSSIGSVNACMVATRGIDETFEIWKSITPGMLQSTEHFFRRLIKERFELIDNGLFTIKELKLLLDEKLDFEELKKHEVYITISEGGPIDTGFLGLVKSSYAHFVHKDEKSVYIPVSGLESDDFNKIILASCSIPIVFPGIKINDHKYYDGGLFDNVPVKPLVESGCYKIIVLHLHRINYVDKDKYPGVTFHEIKHRHSLGGILNFDAERAIKTYELGYADATAYFEEHQF